jgi:hypothetical protein
VRGALVAYTAVIIGIFILGSALPIQLPTITFGEDSQQESGVLLGEDPGSVCGYWYYIDSTGHVVALPSEKATDVVVGGPAA